MELKSKKVLISGGTSGLGLALAEKFMSEGCEVIATGRNENKINELNQKFDNKIKFVKCDITRVEDLEKLQIADIDILINNAGIWIEGDITTNDPTQIQEVINTNLTGNIFFTQRFLPILKAKSSRGFILNIVSTSGIEPRANQAVYSASKYGLLGFSECLKKDLEKTQIKVITFNPGGMNTQLFNSANVQKSTENWMDPNDVAEFLIKLFQMPDGMYVDFLTLRKIV